MKKNHILITTLLLCVSTVLLAQEKSNSYIGVTVGASSPMGDFAKADAGTYGNWNNTAGFAKTGITIAIEGAYYFAPRFGIAGTIYFADHGGFSKSDAQTLGDSYTDAFAVDESTVSTTGGYRSLNIMVGPQYTIPLSSKLDFDVRVLAGVVKSFSTPGMTVQLEDNEDSKLIQKSSTGSAFGWQVGGGFRYSLTSKLGLMLKADYFNSDGVKIDNENRANSAGRLVTTQPMSWLNYSLGIAFKL